MAPQKLTRQQCLLLQRHYDGELSAARDVRANQLLERSASARVFVAAVDELSHAVQGACEVAWEDARRHVPSASVIADLAASADDVVDADLDELAPLLERFHDGEVDATEMAVVSGLLDERDDAIDYLTGLDEVGQGMRAAGEKLVDDVDFDGFWNGIADQIGADSPNDSTAEDFERGKHLVLLQRYVDGEVTAGEAAHVDRWVADGHPEVSGYLEALSELKLGVNAAIETACERADVRQIWPGVREAVNAGSDGADVVSINHTRRPHGDGDHAPSWFGEYRQAIIGALAAAVALAGIVGLFRDQILGSQERVVVEKRVVVVDKVEYSPGSLVRIDSPVEQASAESSRQKPQQQDPTVIWLFDSDNDDESPSGRKVAPATTGDDVDAGTPPRDPDILDGDAGANAAPLGQPI